MTGRVAVAILNNTSSVVAWMANTEEGTELRARNVDLNGFFGATVVLAQLPQGRSTGFPRIASQNNAAHVVWTSFIDGEPRVEAATLRLKE